MKIKWNEVTPFSKYAAMLMFIFFPFASFYLGIQYQKLADVAKKPIPPVINERTPFMNAVSQCPDDRSVSDRYVCLYNLANSTMTEGDTLARKLISQAPIRLKEITQNNIGPMRWEYGGADFLKNLPSVVKIATEMRGPYISSACEIAQMNIYGSNGMDLEKEACIYSYAEMFLRELKSLEGGLTAPRD